MIRASFSFNFMPARITIVVFAALYSRLQVSKKICDALAKRIEKQFNYLERKQMIFELVGVDFIKHYFPQEQYNPMLIVSNRQ